MAARAFSRRAFAKMSAVALGAVAASSSFEATCLANDSSSSAIEGEDVKRIRSCCRGCGKMECGVWVTVRNGRAVAIEGDESAPQSRGNCCAKSQASIQAAYHPDRLYHPMRRTRPKGEDPGWVRITWDEAYAEMAKGFTTISEKYGPTALLTMCGTSRIWSMGGYAGMKMVLGTPNSTVASEICKGPRILTGKLIDHGGSFWMANGDEPRVYVEWGTAVEASNYDETCRTIVDAASHAEKHILIDPRIGGLGKEADYWLNIRPGTDHAVALAWEKIIIDEKLYDELYVKRWTNAPMLVVDDKEPNGGWVMDGSGGLNMKTKLLLESDIVEGGRYQRFMVWDQTKAAAGLMGNEALSYLDCETTQWEGEDHVAPTLEECEYLPEYNGYLPPESHFDSIDPALEGEYEVTFKDGSVHKARPVWTYLVSSLEGKTPEWASEVTGVDAGLIKEACEVWATRPEGQRYGNGGIHFQLATDQTGNCLQTIRTLLHLGHLTGNADSPAGHRGPTKTPMIGANYGGAVGPVFSPTPPWPYREPTITEMNAAQVSGDRFPLLKWYNEWSDATANWRAVLSGEPYPIRGGHDSGSTFMNQSNSQLAWDAICSMDFWAANNLWHHPVTELADILLPAQHWLEVTHARVSQGPSGGIGATIKCIEPPADTRFDPDTYTQLAEVMGIPWCGIPGEPTWPTDYEKRDMAVRLGAEQSRARGEEPLAENWDDFAVKFQEHGWWDAKEVLPDNWGMYHRYETGKMRQPGAMNDVEDAYGFGYMTATSRMEFWPVSLETVVINSGTQDVITYDDIMPDYQESAHTPVSDPEMYKEYPLIVTTGRRIPVYFHSEHRQLPWCREQWPVPRMEINPEDAAELGIEQGDWCWIETPFGKIRETADLYYGIGKGVINLEHAWWFPELPAPTHGSTLCDCNRLNDPDNQDPIIGSTVMRGYLAKVYKATPENCPDGKVVPCAPEDGTEIITSSSDPRLKAWLPNYEIREEA